jgi:hypothetical protein
VLRLGFGRPKLAETLDLLAIAIESCGGTPLVKDSLDKSRAAVVA